MSQTRWKEGNVWFNDALNTFYLQLYSVRTILIVRKETHCHHIGYSFWLAARVLYAPSHRQDSTYHDLCYTNRGALAGTRNRSMGPPHEGSIRWPIAPWANALTTELHLAPRLDGVKAVQTKLSRTTSSEGAPVVRVAFGRFRFIPLLDFRGHHFRTVICRLLVFRFSF